MPSHYLKNLSANTACSFTLFLFLLNSNPVYCTAQNFQIYLKYISQIYFIYNYQGSILLITYLVFFLCSLKYTGVKCVNSVFFPLLLYSGAVEGRPDSEAICLLSIAELIPGLQPLVLWMANSIELLHFIQHEVPLLLPWTQQDEEQDKGTFFSTMMPQIV